MDLKNWKVMHLRTSNDQAFEDLVKMSPVKVSQNCPDVDFDVELCFVMAEQSGLRIGPRSNKEQYKVQKVQKGNEIPQSAS